MTHQQRYLAAQVNLQRLVALYQDTGTVEAKILVGYAADVIAKQRLAERAAYEVEMAPRAAREARLPYA